MKQINTTISLIFFNLIPLLGVLFFEWSIFSVMFIYWAENLVIGFYNILKMWKAEKPVLVEDKVTMNGRPFAGVVGLGIIFFFIIHFGFFTLVHGAIIFGLFYKGNIDVIGILVGVLSLFISHGISYYSNFLRKQEYKKKSRIEQMFQPYSRLIILHLVVIFGGFLIGFLNWDFLAVILLVVIKIVVDVTKHRKEHEII